MTKTGNTTIKINREKLAELLERAAKNLTLQAQNTPWQHIGELLRVEADAACSLADFLRSGGVIEIID